MVYNLNGFAIGCSRGALLVKRIRRLLQSGWTVLIRHIFREANKDVDLLASMGCDYDGFSTFDKPPAVLGIMLLNNVMGVSTPCIVVT